MLSVAVVCGLCVLSFVFRGIRFAFIGSLLLLIM